MPSWLSLTSSGVVSTFAGSTTGSTDGTGTAAKFLYPGDVAVDATGNVYVADTNNQLIRKITPLGVVSTFAGAAGARGYVDATGTSARFNAPRGIDVDAAGNVYVADTNNFRIRKITPAGVVTTVAGSTKGYADGTGTSAQFSQPYGVAVDNSGNIFVADLQNNNIRKITSAGVVSTLAGAASYNSTGGSANGTGTAARFNFPYGVDVDGSGNVYVADGNNSQIRKITPAGVVTTFAGSTTGFADGLGTAAKFANPQGVSIDASDNVFVADSNGFRIRKITPAGLVSTLAGSGGSSYLDGIGTAAHFNYPYGLGVGSDGKVYVADLSLIHI